MHRILVVDANPTACSALRLLLELKGYCVLVSESFETALELVRQADIDLVLLDLHTARMGTSAALLAIRERSTDMPVIALLDSTPVAEADLCLAAVESGAAGALRKPFKPDALLGVIAAGLAGKDL